MTNRELLKTPKELLSQAERQKLHVLRTELTPVPCPACRKPVDALAASDTDIDAFDFGTSKKAYHCPRCGAGLEQVVPFIAAGGPGWHWLLSHDWLAERLHRARLYDQMTTPATGEEDA
jgi:uncharacterized protein (UPF0212 family)